MIKVWVDGSCRDNGGKNALAGVGIVAQRDNKKLFTIGRIVPGKTNNEAEYRAVICALKELKQYHYDSIIIYSDSNLVINQINGAWQIKNDQLKKLCDAVKLLIARTPFKQITFEWIPREQNPEANNIAQAITKDKRGG